MAKFLDKTGLTTVLNSIKSWVSGLFSSTLTITDDNWKEYNIAPNSTAGASELPNGVVYTPSTTDKEWEEAEYKSIYGPLFKIPGNIRTVVFDMKTINIYRFRICGDDWKDGTKLSFMVKLHKIGPNFNLSAYDKYVTIDECIYSNTVPNSPVFENDPATLDQGELVIPRYGTTDIIFSNNANGAFYPFTYDSPTSTVKAFRDYRALIPGRALTAIQFKKRWYYMQ